MSQESLDKIADALNHMVEAANEMNIASTKLRQAGDKATADRLDKVRADFRTLRLDVTNRVTESDR